MKKKVKGFTLIEMIIVVALFGLIMAGALSLLQPIRRVYKDAFDFEGSRATVNNVRQFVEDNVKYANRIIVLTNCNDIYTDLSSIANITDIADHGSNGINHGDGINVLELMRSKYMLGTDPYSYSGNVRTRISRADDEIFAIRIDNPELDGDGNLILNDYTLGDENRGQVTYQVYRYPENNYDPIDSETKISNEALYREYSLMANLGELITDSLGNPILDAEGFSQYSDFNPENFALTLEIYKNKRNPTTGLFDLENAHVNSVITFSLVNIFTQGVHQRENITYYASGAKHTTNPGINKYALYDCGQDTNDIILVFTQPPRL